jgi:hypothetical protein
MFCLIPLPFMGQFVRRASFDTGRVNDNTLKRAKSNGSSEEGNLSNKREPTMTKGVQDRYNTDEAMNAEVEYSYN